MKNLDPKLLDGIKGHEGCVIFTVPSEKAKKVVKKLRIRNYPSLELFHNGSLKLNKIIASLTLNPAKILGIDKGSLQIGRDADLCVVDINKPWVVNKDELLSKSKNTPIEDRKLQGQIIKTFIKGEIAFERA